MNKTKECKICNESFAATIEYFYKNKSSKDGLNPYCKQCTINKSKKYQKDNPEWSVEYSKKAYQRKEQYFKDKAIRWSRENEERAKGLQKEWRQNNPEKLKEYREERLFHKKHEISDDELNELYQYANHCCMYCGINETESLQLYNQKLHKDHAYNDGSNGIDNCILACKSCNSSKRDKDWIEWFTSDNPKYTDERYIMISEWLSKF